MKICKLCKIEKPFSEFSPCGKYKDKIYYRGECSSCNSIVQKVNPSYKVAAKKYRSTNEYREKRNSYKRTDKYRKYERSYRKLESYKKKRQAYEKNKLATNVRFKLKHYLRCRLRNFLKGKRFNKYNHFSKYIGCSLSELKAHLESKFQPGMTWDNYGDWHIDHIIPLASATSDEQLYSLCHYSNLQPLWAIDNIKKSNKII